MTNEVFKSLFGPMWGKLPPVFLKRYSNRSCSADIITVEGNMDIHYSKLVVCFIPVMKLLRLLAPYRGKNIPVKVDFRSQQQDVCIERTFYFPDQEPYSFNSCMHLTADNNVIEYLSYGMGWKSHYFFDGVKIVMQHQSYVLKIFGLAIPLPLSFIIGKGHAEEVLIDDNSYRVTMTITHPLFGELYRYSGDFSLTRLLQ